MTGPNDGVSRADRNKFTPTELKMLGVLSDGLPHSKAELKGCFPDEHAEASGVRVMICSIRKKMAARGKGYTIVCEVSYNRYGYRHVRLISNAE